METFTGFIRDDRYSTVTFRLFTAASERAARGIVRADLSSNPHHVAFEVRDADDRLLFVARQAPRSAPVRMPADHG